MGRRSHKPDPTSRRQVEAMAGYGVPEADIACVLDLDPKTLRKHYRSELDKGHIKATTRVAENLYRKATGEGREAVTAAIFWLKTRAGWKETLVQETKAEIRYVVRMPEPVANMDDWLRRYSSRTIEHEPAAPVGGPFPRLVTERPA
jgi:hypothetical protein